MKTILKTPYKIDKFYLNNSLIIMKKIFYFAVVCIASFILASCSCNNQNSAEEALESPETTEAVADSTESAETPAEDTEADAEQ